MSNKPSKSELELYDALATCAVCLNVNFATPDTIEGGRAVAAVNKAKTALINFSGRYPEPSNQELLLAECASMP